MGLGTSWREGVERGSLHLFYLFTALTVAGYATFGVHPELLARVPWAAGVYGFAFRFFAVGHVVLAGSVLALLLTLRVGGRWIPAFLILYGISLASELSGTITGLPFGEYRYSELLGPMWFGHVPWIIPLSWFFMAVPSYALSGAVGRGSRGWVLRVLLGSAVLLSWDLSLDPAMSHATRYWIWGSTGPYYGMPWVNLFGWYLTGLGLMGALAALRADRWLSELPLPWLAGFFLANLALPMGMNAAASLWGAVALAAGVLVATVWVARRLDLSQPVSPRRRSSPGAEASVPAGRAS